MSRRNMYRELVKNDPNFHDIRAKILLEASNEIKRYASTCPYGVGERYLEGLLDAATELRRMASNARKAHSKHQTLLRQQRKGSEAKARAFGF